MLYVCGDETCPRQAAILRSNLAQIGIDVEVKQFPGPVLFSKLHTRGEPFDIGWIGWLTPAVPFAYDTTLTLVSSRVDPKCVIVNPDLDLAAVCLKPVS